MGGRREQTGQAGGGEESGSASAAGLFSGGPRGRRRGRRGSMSILNDDIIDPGHPDAVTGRQAATVATAKATTTDWQSQMDAVGSLRAVNGADLSLEVAGVVETLDFQSGDDVEAGKVLLKLRDFDDVAKLKSLEAQADLAKITYDRDVKQLNAKAVAQAVVDNDEANLRNIRAQVEQQRALVETKTLKAPFWVM